MAKPALIVGIALIGLGTLIWGPEGLFNRHSDLIAYHLGTQTVLHQSWQNAHRIPLWRPDILSGEPALTNPQALFTHPFHALFAFFKPDRVVGLVIWLQIVTGALGAYYAAGALRLSGAARVMVAVAVLFSFKTILAVYAGWLSVLAGIAALPLWFGAVARAVEDSSVKATLILGLSGALFLHSGNLQLFYYAALFTFVWVAVRVGRLVFGGNRRAAAVLTTTLVSGAAIAAGLSAYLWIPLAHDTGIITRSVASYTFFLGAHPTSLIDLLTFFNPEVFGTPLDGTFVEAWEYVAYVGAVTSLFALAGVAEWRRRPMVRVLVLGLLLSMLLAIETPLLRVAHASVPGYDLFRLPARILFLSAFFVCALAGVGLDRILSSVSAVSRRKAVAFVAVALVALEGSFWAQRYLSAAEPIPFRRSAEFIGRLRSGDFPARVAPLSRSLPSYGAASLEGLELVTGYDSYVMRHYQTYMDLVQHNRTRETRPAVWTDIETIGRFDLLAALNVLYIVSAERLEIPSNEYALVGSFDHQPQFRFYEGMATGPAYVYKNLRFLPRAFFVSTVISASDERAVLKAVEETDVRETAVVAAPAPGGPSAATDGDRIEIRRASGGELELLARNAARRFVLLSEVWHPGWSVRVDGRPAPLVRADVALLGLWLEPGEHHIELRFWPPGLTVGLLVTGITVLGVLFTLARLAIKPHSAAPLHP